MPDTASLRVLLVEDNPVHAKLISRAIHESQPSTEVIHVTDGEPAMDMLLRRGDYLAEPTWRLPDLVVLDLRLPDMDGFEVLQVVRATESIRHLPVIVVSSSDLQEDVMLSYRHGANTYIVKPADYSDFLHRMGGLHEYWRKVAVLPRGAHSA